MNLTIIWPLQLEPKYDMSDINLQNSVTDMFILCNLYLDNKKINNSE